MSLMSPALKRQSTVIVQSSSICAVFGENVVLIEGALASMPLEAVSEFVLVGPKALQPSSSRRRGCKKHLEIELTAANLPIARDYLSALPEGTVVLPVDEVGADFVSDLGAGKWIVTPTPSPAISKELRDKWSFFLLCRRLNIPVPQTLLHPNKESIDFDQLASTLGLPIIFKPVNESASIGVLIIESCEDFEKRLLQNAAYQFAPIIAQQFIPGVDGGVSVLASDGEILHYAIQLPSGKEIRFVHNALLLSVTTRLIKETRYSGFMNIDLRLRSEGTVELLECNARTWATMRAATWCGLNFIRAAVDFARGNSSKELASLASCSAPQTDKDMLKAIANGFMRRAAWTADQKRIVRHFLTTIGPSLKRRMLRKGTW
jgi:hypothetical protein